jgi:hypothetical protein
MFFILKIISCLLDITIKLGDSLKGFRENFIQGNNLAAKVMKDFIPLTGQKIPKIDLVKLKMMMESFKLTIRSFNLIIRSFKLRLIKKLMVLAN